MKNAQKNPFALQGARQKSTAKMLCMLVALAVLLLLKSCAKELPLMEASSVITMTTRASEVRFYVTFKESVKNHDNLTIDWGDGKKSQISDAIRSVAEFKTYIISRSYSGAFERRITIAGDNIERLECANSQLTALDVSRNTELSYLNCGDNELTTLDVSQNTELKVLYCSLNQLTALDVSGNLALTGLFCGSNQFTDLDVSRNTALTDLYCNNNQLTVVDVSRNAALTGLDVCHNQITKLDVSANTMLQLLCCKSCQFSDAALNDLFISLPTIPETKWSVIDYGGNPGDRECDISIAEKKGWEIGTVHGSRIRQ